MDRLPVAIVEGTGEAVRYMRKTIDEGPADLSDRHLAVLAQCRTVLSDEIASFSELEIAFARPAPPTGNSPIDLQTVLARPGFLCPLAGPQVHESATGAALSVGDAAMTFQKVNFEMLALQGFEVVLLRLTDGQGQQAIRDALLEAGLSTRVLLTLTAAKENPRASAPLNHDFSLAQPTRLPASSQQGLDRAHAVSVMAPLLPRRATGRMFRAHRVRTDQRQSPIKYPS